MNNDSNGRSMSKESVYRALTLGACGGALAWVRFHDLNRAIVAAVVTVIGTMGIEFTGQRLPAWQREGPRCCGCFLSCRRTAPVGSPTIISG